VTAQVKDQAMGQLCVEQDGVMVQLRVVQALLKHLLLAVPAPSRRLLGVLSCGMPWQR